MMLGILNYLRKITIGIFQIKKDFIIIRTIRDFVLFGFSSFIWIL